MDVTHHKIDDLRTNRDALRSRLVEMTRTYCPPPANVENVVILKDADSVGKRNPNKCNLNAIFLFSFPAVTGQHIREIVAEEAESAISRRGHFALAIPGGSILKMLAGGDFKEESWMSKTTIFYVNHKCVSMEDPELATHAKANKLFLMNGQVSMSLLWVVLRMEKRKPLIMKSKCCHWMKAYCPLIQNMDCQCLTYL